jgi:hypothetical protein
MYRSIISIFIPENPPITLKITEKANEAATIRKITTEITINLLTMTIFLETGMVSNALKVSSSYSLEKTYELTSPYINIPKKIT